VLEGEFEAMCRRAVRGMRLGGAGSSSDDMPGGESGPSIALPRVHAPLPESWLRPWLNMVGITSLVYVWSGFVGMVLGLYLLSAEVWTEQTRSEWSIALLSGAGMIMMGLGVVAFIQSRRGWI